MKTISDTRYGFLGGASSWSWLHYPSFCKKEGGIVERQFHAKKPHEEEYSSPLPRGSRQMPIVGKRYFEPDAEKFACPVQGRGSRVILARE